jgi:predicted secreted protein with PEFG-CTERM motif
MKVITLSSLVVLFAIASMVTIAPNAFADHHMQTVTNAQGSSTPGCEETADGCFIPSPVTIPMGGTVTWENGDTAAHTATGGSATEGPSGVFDSSLIMAGSSFSHTFEEAGSFDYFCMVHPWMAGLVMVEAEAAAEPEPEPEPVMEEVHEEEHMEEEVHESVPPTMSVGSTTMTGNTGAGDMIDLLHWNISSGSDVLGMHVDEDAASLVIEMTSTDDGELFVALDETYIGSDDGTFFIIVGGEESIDYEQAGNDLFISFPAGTESIEIIGSYAVPEFGTIAMIVLAVAIVSIIAITAKTRTTLIPKF